MRCPEPAPSPLSHDEFEAMEPVSRIENDRFCGDCGYNLLRQPVRRDDRSGVLLVHCPECGGFEAATARSPYGGLWVRRAAFVGLILWISLLLSLQGMVIGIQASFTAVTVDELTRWESVTTGAGQPSGTEIHRSYRYSRRTDLDAEEVWIPRILATSAFMMALAFGVIVAGALPHWKRWALAVWAVVWPVAVALLIYFPWTKIQPDLATWVLQISVPYTIAAAVGGAIAAYLGRPILRGLVRAFLTPRLREPFAYLWTADGRKAPTWIKAPQPV